MQKRIKAITKILDDNKAIDIDSFDLHKTDYIVDFVVIATAMGERHLNALFTYLQKNLKDEKILYSQASDEWVVVDLGDIIIHIMSENARTKYDIETFLKQFASKDSQ